MKQATVNKRHTLILPDKIAEWDAISHWERPRFASMEEHIQPGMVLLDVGAEHGWISAILAGFVGGGDNMILVEPTPEFWRNIRLTWEANGLAKPRLMCQALVGNDGHTAGIVDWPDCSEGEEFGVTSYRYLHEPKHLEETPCTTIDTLAAQSPVDAITIDVEGAELEVLRSGVATLLTSRPLVWASLHPDLMERDYGTNPDEVIDFMRAMQYDGEYLGTDHEQHWFFRPA